MSNQDNTVIGRRTRGPGANKAREIDAKKRVTSILSDDADVVYPLRSVKERNELDDTESVVSDKEDDRANIPVKGECSEETFIPNDTFFNTWSDAQRVSVKESLMQHSPAFSYDRDVFRTPEPTKSPRESPQPSAHRSPLIPPMSPESSDHEEKLEPTRIGRYRNPMITTLSNPFIDFLITTYSIYSNDGFIRNHKERYHPVPIT